MKTLIFGNGWLGNKLRDYFTQNGHECRISTADITDQSSVWADIVMANYDAVINCAAKTGTPNVDWCEDHREETFRSNVLGPLTLERICREQKQYWVHIGTGCLYEGDNGGKGWSEDDPPNFYGGFYIRTKAMTEQLLVDKPVLQLRIRLPVSSAPEPRNLITKLAGYSKVVDVPNSMTVIEDFLPAALTLIERRKTGIYHVTNPGGMSPLHIMKLYEQMVDPTTQHQSVDATGLNGMTKARRSNCILSVKKLAAEGITLRPIEDAVTGCLLNYAKHVQKQPAPTAKQSSAFTP